MLGRLPTTVRRRTVAGDKGYDTKGFVAEARALVAGMLESVVAARVSARKQG